MIRAFDTVYAVDGKPLLQPDYGYPEISETDIDEEESGRDEAKVMHRVVAREGVMAWKFYYKYLDREDLEYIKSLFRGRPEFSFTHDVADDGTLLSKEAYSSKRTYKKHDNHKFNGLYRDLEFTIIER